jgi:hypothetical protein
MNEQKFQNIYHLTYPKISRYVVSKCRNIEDVKDILQNIYMDVYKKMDMIDKFIFMNSNDDIKQIESLRKKFNDNYSQMKSNGPHAHGNVFYDQGGNVYLVEDIKREIFKLKDNFLS